MKLVNASILMMLSVMYYCSGPVDEYLNVSIATTSKSMPIALMHFMKHAQEKDLPCLLVGSSRSFPAMAAPCLCAG